MLSLQHPYISIALPHGKSYGGGQQHSRDAMLRRCGCGVVAAADLLLYLTRWHSHGAVDYFAGLLTDEPVPLPVYDALLRDLSRREFPMIPYAGINGVMLMAGMQLFFRRHGMPYTARWCIAPGRLWERIEEMLGADIPVIMSVGPNFPFIWGDKRVRFTHRPRPAAMSRRPGQKPTTSRSRGSTANGCVSPPGAAATICAAGSLRIT